MDGDTYNNITAKGINLIMKTTAIGIVATIFASIAGVLSQKNYLTYSIWFGLASVGFLLFSLFVHHSESKKGIIKPDLKIELIPTPSFCSSFDSELPNESINIHRTAIILYLKITNVGNAPTEIGDIHVGYESMENDWYWLLEETTLLDDYQIPIGEEKIKIFPFLKQKNYLTENDTNGFLNPGQSRNGIVYFEQKASGGNLYPKMDEEYKVKIKIQVHDTKGFKWTIEKKISKVIINAAREHCPSFGKTLLLTQSV
ncbi:MAG: hypothetical protein WC504_08230 [Methylobacter sp.]